MKGDYYAILGVSPASEDVVIRAAYRALMRRYHPDTDPSSDATERARAINAAYAVLSDPEKRARYDGSLTAQGLIKLDPQPRAPVALRVPRPGPAAVGALAVFAGLLVLIAVSPPIAELPGTPALIGSPGEAAPLAAEQVRAAAAAAPDEAGDACSDEGAHRLIKSELFSRAARLRGSDAPAFAAVAGRAHMRIALSEAAGREGRAVGCSGWLAIDLPPGLVVEGGRSNLNADIGYSLVPAGVGTFRLAGLSGTEGLVAALSSLGRAAREEPLTEPGVELAAAPALPQARPRAAAPVRVHRPSTAPAMAERRVARPSRSPATKASSPCDGISGRAERAICRNSNLAALDRQLVLFTGQSLKAADADKKAALLGSSARFREQRDSCRSDACMTEAYLARMREVGDIMAGRTQ